MASNSELSLKKVLLVRVFISARKLSSQKKKTNPLEWALWIF